jgi:16S rRNA (uracil1498-N3)-methyltransferase
MPDRYFVSEPIVADRARLIGEEAHHLCHVMRARLGDEVVVFDGSGAQWQARVERLGRSEVELALFDRLEVDRELPIEIALAVALPKGDRQRWLVEKAVELGVHGLTPLITARGVAQPAEKPLLRLRRAVIEASKQCGRNRLMAIGAPIECCGYFASPPTPAGIRAVADPSGERSLESLFEKVSGLAPRSADFAIGPEGGFSPEELALAKRHGWPVIGLGPRILRVETAAVYLAAVSAAMTMAK